MISNGAFQRIEKSRLKLHYYSFLVFCLLLNCGVYGGGASKTTSEEESDPLATSGTSSVISAASGHGGHNNNPSSSSQNRYEKHNYEKHNYDKHNYDKHNYDKHNYDKHGYEKHGYGYDKQYSSSMYPSSALSYYGYPTSYPYNYNYNPYAPSDPYYERNGKDFSTRSSNNIPMAASSNYGYGITSPEFGGLAMASSHGHSHGWGWPKSSYSGSKVDTSAIGLLGLIGLFSLLQNVLLSLTTTTTTTVAGRKKRDLGDTGDDVTQEEPQRDGVQRANEISLMVLPALNVVAHARNGRIPLECTRREVCHANHLLVKELGVQGRTVGSMISSAITKLLKEVDETGSIGKHLTKAGLAGRNGEKCHIVYPVCDSLKKGAKPLPMLMQPSHFTQFGINRNDVPRPNTLN